MTVNELVAAFWKHAQVYYRKPDGSDTGGLHCLRDAARPLCRLYGDEPVEAFGPIALKAVRQTMIDADISRRETNRRVGRILRVFKWGVGEKSRRRAAVRRGELVFDFLGDEVHDFHTIDDAIRQRAAVGRDAGCVVLTGFAGR